MDRRGPRALGTLLDECSKRGVQVTIATRMLDEDLQSKRQRRGRDVSQLDLNVSQLDLSSWTGGIHEQAGHPRLGQQFTQQLELLADQFAQQERNAGRVAARPIEACDEAEVDGISGANEDDWNRLRG